MAAPRMRPDVALKAAKDRVAKALAAQSEPDPKDIKLLEEHQQQQEQPQVQKVYPQPPLLLQAPSMEKQRSQSTTHQSEGASDGREDAPKRKRLSVREQEYYEFFDQRFGPLVVLLLWLFTTKLERAVFYAPTPAECHELAPHLAHLGPKLEDLVHLPKWVHTAIVTSDDTVTIGMVMMGYLDRIGVLDKMAPWFSGVGEKARNGYEQAHSDSGVGSVPPVENRAADELRHRSNGAYTGKPIDLRLVRGIGEQYRPS